jgi:hypothetical protein
MGIYRYYKTNWRDIMIYFSWTKPKAPFDINALETFEEEVLGIKIDHVEGGFPSATVVIAKTDATPDPLPEHAVLFYERDGKRHLLFKGRLITPPLARPDRCLSLELTAETRDALAILELDQRPLKVLPFFDPLFVHSQNENDLDEILEGYTKLPHWNRQGDFCFSDILTGTRIIDLGDSFDKTSLKTRLVKKPIDAISVEIEAQWIQEYQGLINLSPCIMEALPDRMISTLSPKYVQKHWWKKGHKLPQTPYQIAQSELVPFDPLTGGAESRFPIFSAPFHIEERFPVHLPRFCFVPHVLVCFSYRQKRGEHVRFTLPSPFEPRDNGKKTEKKLRFTLQDIRKDLETPTWAAETTYHPSDQIQRDGKHYECQESHLSSPRFDMDESYWSRVFQDKSPLGNQAASSYFQTPRGAQSIMHAVERASAHLIAGARVQEITFDAPFDTVEGIDCDTSITLKDARLPGGSATGKVVGYTLLFKHSVSLARIRLLKTNGTKIEHPVSLEEVWRKTPSGVCLGKPQSKTPLPGIKDPHLLEGADIFKRLKVIDGVDDQNARLHGKTFHSLKEAEATLQKNPTRFSIELLPLNQQQKLRHDMEVPVLGQVLL